MSNIIMIGRPGTFDPAFGLIKHLPINMCFPLFEIVLLDKGTPVAGIGWFNDPIDAEQYIKKHRERLINDIFEDVFL